MSQEIGQLFIQSPDGANVPSAGDFRGKVLVILFFSLGCPGCLGRAVPYANRLIVEHGDKVEVLAIHSGMLPEGDLRETFTKFKQKFFLRFPVFLDENGDKTFKAYRAGGTPHWLIVDQEGSVRLSMYGSDPNKGLLKLDYLMAELLAK